MTTKCLARWLPADFGKRLHHDCHGCARRLMFGDPLGVDTKPPPEFSDKCPERVEGEKK
jgi:hypothetical protein